MLKSTLKAKRPRVAVGLEMKPKIIAEVKPGKQAADTGCEEGILSTTVRTTAADKQKYKDIEKLAVPGKENVWEKGKSSVEKEDIIALYFLQARYIMWIALW